MSRKLKLHQTPTTPKELQEYALKTYKLYLKKSEKLRLPNITKQYLQNFFFHDEMSDFWQHFQTNKILNTRPRLILNMVPLALTDTFVFPPSAETFTKKYVQEIERQATVLLKTMLPNEITDESWKLVLKIMTLEKLLLVEDLKDSESIQQVANLVAHCQKFLKSGDADFIHEYIGSRKSSGESAVKNQFIKNIGALFVKGFKKPMYSTIAILVDKIFLGDEQTSVDAVKKLVKNSQAKKGSFAVK